MGKKRVRGGNPKATAAIAALAVLTVVLCVMAFSRQSGNPPTSDPGPTFTVTPSPSHTPPTRPQLTQVAARLSDNSKPFSVVVLGDSTSASSPINWTFLLGQWMGKQYDRPVNIEPWSVNVDPPAYAQTVHPYPGGHGKPVTMWVSGASGKGVQYTQENLDALVPREVGSPGWIIINHGHNARAGTLAGDEQRLLDELETRWPKAVKTVIAQNPERPDTPGASPHRANTESMVSQVEWTGYGVIDVMTPFSEKTDYGSMIDKSIHPNAAGYRLWADVVQDALKAAAK